MTQKSFVIGSAIKRANLGMRSMAMLKVSALEEFTPRLATLGLMYSYHSDPWDMHGSFESVTICYREEISFPVSPIFCTIEAIEKWISIIETIAIMGIEPSKD